MNNRNRKWLIASILGVEAVCLIGIVAGAFAWTREAFVKTSTSQAIADNRLIAAQFSRFIQEMEIDDITPHSTDWQRLQSIVAEFKLPNDGFVSVSHSSNGSLICHPELDDDPSLASSSPGKALLKSDEGESPIFEQVALDGNAVGQAMFDDGIHILAAHRLSRLNSNVMVHQKKSAILAKASNNASPIIWIGAIAGGLVIGLTGLGCLWVLKQHDASIERTNTTMQRSLKKQTQSLMKTRNAVIFGLAKLAEFRDTDTGEHLDRIRDYSTLLARELRRAKETVDQAFVDNIGLASALHDIGKVGIPDSVLLKPGRLNPEERKIIEKHPEIGCMCLLHIEKKLGEDNFLNMATEICLAHHEKWDGTGYPLGLKQNQIPLAARIVAVADVYDALTSKRPYKEPMSHDEALQIILEGNGKHFDPDIIAAFLTVADDFQSICEQYHQGIVPRDNDNFNMEPLEALDTAKTLHALGIKTGAEPCSVADGVSRLRSEFRLPM